MQRSFLFFPFSSSNSSSPSSMILSSLFSFSLLCLMGLLLASSSSPSFSPINQADAAKIVRGVSPENKKNYHVSKGSFKCIDGEKSIPFSSVNDDFCDCSDGSDEPGTSACPNSTFYCRNKYFIAKIIPSMQVNDGICDCCDASDEYLTKSCTNTCDEMGEAMRIANERKVKLHEMALKKRFEGVKRGLQQRKERTETLKMLRERVIPERAEADRLKEYKEEKEAAEREATQAHQEKWKQEKEERRKAKEELEQLQKQVQEQEPSQLSEGTEENQESSSSPQVVVTEEEEEKMPEYDDATKALIEEATVARNAYNVENDKATATEREITELEKKLARNLGEEQQFCPLEDVVFKLETSEYIYEFHPFSKIVQKSHTGGTVNLGTFAGWAGSPNLFSVMKFDNGDKCWGGPNRSVNVNFSCGERHDLLSVSEPNKCEYVMEFITPAICDPDLKLDIPKAEEEDDTIDFHDEF